MRERRCGSIIPAARISCNSRVFRNKACRELGLLVGEHRSASPTFKSPMSQLVDRSASWSLNLAQEEEDDGKDGGGKTLISR